MWEVNDDFRNLRKEGQKAMLGEINYDSPFTQFTAVGLIKKMKVTGSPFYWTVG